MKIEYIDGDKDKGIKYDWKLVKKEYRKLKIPKKYYNPLHGDPEKAAYHVAMSDRTHGKTTETLLLGMLLHKLYGTIIHYIRNGPNSIKPMALNQLFPVIVDNGYIEIMTDGQYNSVYYYGHKWYYCTVDENGKRVDTAPTHFMICMALTESDDRKSTYQCPTGDFIIFDEFIELSGYGYNDFMRFSDLVSTIFRKRLSGVIYMLSNTIELNSPWFDELCLREHVDTMQHGECRYIESVLGTVSFVDILDPDTSQHAQDFVKRYFGFLNPKLNAITGRGTWATAVYPHIPTNDEWRKMHAEDDEEKPEPKMLYGKLYVRQSGKLMRLQLMQTEIGLCVYVVPALRTYDDSLILTHEEIKAYNEFFAFGPRGSNLEIYWKLYAANRFYYTHNNLGALFAAYVKQANEKLKKVKV